MVIPPTSGLDTPQKLPYHVEAYINSLPSFKNLVNFFTRRNFS